MRINSVLIILALTAVAFSNIAYAYIPGYQYYIPVDVYNPNPYPVYKYPIIFDLNLQPYTLSDYNDIRIEAIVGDNVSEINYSKQILSEGTVRIYAYLDEIPASGSVRLHVYVGRLGDVDHSVPINDAIGEYLAVRFRDAYLGGSTWTPNWYEIQSCTDRVWEDAGRDAFDNFLYPRIIVNGDDVPLYASPYSNCNPYYVYVDGVHLKYENYAYGYATYSDPHNPGSTNQRVWVQEIMPRCDDRNKVVSIEYRVWGNLGSDALTRMWEYNTTILGNIQIHYFQTNDESDPYGTLLDPQIHYAVVFGDGGQYDTFTLRFTDWVSHTVEYTGLAQPITYLLSVGDVHGYFEQFLASSAYLGEPCYMDTPIEYNVGSAVYLANFHASVPATMYRGQTYTIQVYYDGNYQVSVVTDWGYEANAVFVEENKYVVQVPVDTNVSIGTHTITFNIGGVFEKNYTVFVDYGGIPHISSIHYTQNVPTGAIYIGIIGVTCTVDTCKYVDITANSNGCFVLDREQTLADVVASVERYVDIRYVCYDTGDYNISITVASPVGSDATTITVSPYLQSTATTAQISAPDVVDPNADVPVTVSTTNYEGNVTVSLLDGNFTPIAAVDANSNGLGVYYTTLHLNGLSDGQYYLLAAGDSFSVAKVLVVSSYAFINPYGVLVKDAFGKPASMLLAEVNGDYLYYTVNIYNLRNTPFTVYADAWLSDGGIMQLPAEFADVLDTAHVESIDGATQYQVSYSISGGAISLVWSADSSTLTLAPGDNTYRIIVKSPYVERLKLLYDTTADPTIYTYLQQAIDANYAYEQAKIYYTAIQYMQSAMYGGITVNVVVPPSAIQSQTSYGFVYISNSAGYIDPTTMTCEVVDETGNTISTCELTKVDTGIYKVQLYTDSIGTYGIKVSASAGLFASQGIAYYQVASQYQQGEITVTNFVVPPNGTTTVIYSQDPAATVQIFMYDTAGTLVKSGMATYDSSIGAFVYELNVGDVTPGDYIVVASDNFGYSDRAIIRVSPILEDILASVSDINTFLRAVIDPKLDTLNTKVDQILDGQTNLYAAIQEVNANTVEIINLINQLEQNIDAQHAETIEYLHELNATAYQILNEILYIKNKIDNVVIAKLDLVLYNQSELNNTVNDIVAMLDCNQPSAVCLQLQNIQLLLQDLNDDITANHQEVLSRLDTIEGKVDTLQLYVDNVIDLLECNTAYPTTSVCAKLDVLQTRVDSILDDLTDMNSFLNTIYDYIRNDLTNEVIAVGTKVEDLNAYLHGDIWNKLADIYNQVNGLYVETNQIKTLITGHDAVIQAQLDALMAYLQDVNATLYTQIESLRSEIMPYLISIDDKTTDIKLNTETLINYFGCTTPNEVCDRLNNIYTLANEINHTNYQIILDVNEVKGIAVSGFEIIENHLDAIDANISELRSLLTCDLVPTSSVCERLSDIKSDTEQIRTDIAELNESIMKVFKELDAKIDQVKTMAGGGGGGGPSTITPIKVVYKAGSVYLAVPEYIPPGEYKILYSGDLYRYVKSPAPGETIQIDDGILALELQPDAKGVISGEVQLRSGSRVYRIKVDIVADERLNQIVGAMMMDGKIKIDIPEGGAKVVFKGPIEHCVAQDTFYFKEGGTYYIKTTCDADGVVEVVPNDRAKFNQATIQITVSQKQNILQTADLMQTTVIPMVAFFAFAVLISYLGLL